MQTTLRKLVHNNLAFTILFGKMKMMFQSQQIILNTNSYKKCCIRDNTEFLLK